MNLFEKIGQLVVVGSLVTSMYLITTMVKASAEGETDLFGGKFRLKARRTTYGNNNI